VLEKDWLTLHLSILKILFQFGFKFPVEKKKTMLENLFILQKILFSSFRDI
jgi:hypothetical protein